MESMEKPLWKNRLLETGGKKIQGGFSGMEGRFSAPLKGFQLREMHRTLDETALLSLYGTARWEIIPAFPCVREAPAFFHKDGLILEKQTLNRLLACALMPQSTFLPPSPPPTWECSQASLTPIALKSRKLMRHISEKGVFNGSL